jgi:hypothetical protein
VFGRSIGIKGEKFSYIQDSPQTHCFGRDVAQTNGADNPLPRLAAEEASTFRPESLANLAVFADQMGGKSQNEQHDGLGNLTHHSAGGDIHGDSMLGARLQIDIVVANAATTDRTQAR